jgi:hypothetical protein
LDGLTIWKVFETIVALATLGLMLAFFYDLITGRAGKTRLILEGVVFLVLMTIAVGIRPPAPPVPSERN